MKTNVPRPTAMPPIRNNEEELRASYSQQRKDRMQDAIDDYLNDERVSARQTYEEMLFGIDDVIKHHKSSLERAVALKELMLGHRAVDAMEAWGNSDLEYMTQNVPKRY
jgi:hypothetical protein